MLFRGRFLPERRVPDFFVWIGHCNASAQTNRLRSAPISTDAVRLTPYIADRHFQPMQDCLQPNAEPNCRRLRNGVYVSSIRSKTCLVCAITISERPDYASLR
jgi:hypothetical protein